MKDVGLVGVPFSGRSTLFTALTRAGSHGGQANVAVVPVPDPRLAVLSEMERSRKTVAAQVRFVDVPGGVSSAQGIARLREADALAIVVRCFGADAAPAAELESVRAELLLADLAVIEARSRRPRRELAASRDPRWRCCGPRRPRSRPRPAGRGRAVGRASPSSAGSPRSR
ncbi:MAG: GTPase [Actinomycetota bacterium]